MAQSGSSNIKKSTCLYDVFGPIVQTHEDINLVGYKWIFLQKYNNEMDRSI